MSGSPPPMRAATVISLMRRVKILPRFASWRPLRCWMFAHLLWPAIWSRYGSRNGSGWAPRPEDARENVMVTFASRPSPERKTPEARIFAARRQTGGTGDKHDGEDRGAQGPDPADARGDARGAEGRA